MFPAPSSLWGIYPPVPSGSLILLRCIKTRSPSENPWVQWARTTGRNLHSCWLGRAVQMRAGYFCTFAFRWVVVMVRLSVICEGGSGTTRPDIPETASEYIVADRPDTSAAFHTSPKNNPNSTNNSETSTSHNCYCGLSCSHWGKTPCPRAYDPDLTPTLTQT